MWQDLFQGGRLMLSDTPAGAGAPVAEGFPLLAEILLLVFIVLAILLLSRFLHLFPLLADSIFRVRGGRELEDSVRNSHDRNLVAIILLIPALLLVFRYRLYDPSFLHGLDGSLRLLALAVVMLVYLLLHRLLYLWMRPRRQSDLYQRSNRAVYNYFILFMLVALLTVGVLAFFPVKEFTVRVFLYGEGVLVFLLFLWRRAQILSLFCNPLRTFLYLCGLEILPAVLLVVSALM